MLTFSYLFTTCSLFIKKRQIFHIYSQISLNGTQFFKFLPNHQNTFKCPAGSFKCPDGSFKCPLGTQNQFHNVFYKKDSKIHKKNSRNTADFIKHTQKHKNPSESTQNIRKSAGNLQIRKNQHEMLENRRKTNKNARINTKCQKITRKHIDR